jgi:hypothetical protein
MSLSGTPPLVFIRPHDDAVELGPAFRPMTIIASQQSYPGLFVICNLSFVMEPEGLYDLTSTTLTWRNWQTRTAQDRMG